MLHDKAVVCAAAVTLVMGGCTGRGWTRPETADPWRQLGPSPTVAWVEQALRSHQRHQPPSSCPFQLLRCGRSEPGSALGVDRLACRAVDRYTDRCSFRLTETVPGREGGRPRSATSACTAIFTPVFGAHFPAEWALSWFPEHAPALRCG
ncbi:MAG TPA: hypothetical protein VK358_04440 [Longimicrobium sp.]|nr:hypothetical protein [Longimicrobium sp.]